MEIQDGYGTIRCELINTETGTIKWNGTFNSQISHSTKTDLQYVPNEPVQISFPGGFLKTETSEGILRISYDLPRLDEEGVPSGSRRQRGEQTINLTGTPKTERLPVPQYSDVRGRWSENDSVLLGSLAWGTESRYSPHSYSQPPRIRLGSGRALQLEPEEPRLPEAVAPTDETRRRRRALSRPSAQDADWPYLNVITERVLWRA